MKEMKSDKKNPEVLTGILTIVFAAIGLTLFLLSYTTGYYTFGSGNSSMILTMIGVAILAEVFYLFLQRRMTNDTWIGFLTFVVSALLAAAALLLIGDRVEAIGTTVVTDYDSGHGGEEAVYMSLVAAGFMLVGMVINMVGSFSKGAVDAAKAKVKGIIAVVISAVITAALLVLLVVLLGSGKSGASAGSGTDAAAVSKSYTISYNQENNNLEDMPDSQFLCSDFSALVKVDSRFYVDLKLTLDGNGNYSLFSDAYVIESGKRAEVGDSTGLGLVLTTNAEGTYTDNGDGTVTTAPATHAVFEMKTDTYSAQMKESANMNVDGNTDDGVYDSKDAPAVLDFVPEATWTLNDDGMIQTYEVAGEDETEDETEAADSAETEADATAASTLAETEAEAAAAASDETEAEAAEAASAEASGEVFTVPGDDGATAIDFAADGTYTFRFDQYHIEDKGTWTYDGKTLTLTDANKKETTAEGDPLKLHYAYSQSDQLTGDFTIAAADLQESAG